MENPNTSAEHATTPEHIPETGPEMSPETRSIYNQAREALREDLLSVENDQVISSRVSISAQTVLYRVGLTVHADGIVRPIER